MSNTKVRTGDGAQDRTVLLLLQNLGLSQNEAKCYLATLTLNSANIQEIAKEAGIHRVSVYGATKTLLERGLVEEEVTKNGRLIHSAALENLKELARTYQKRASKLRWKIEDLIPSLLAFSAKTPERPRLLIFEGQDALIRLLRHTLEVMPTKSPTREICLFLDKEEGRFDTEEFSKNVYIPERVRRKGFKYLLCSKTKHHLSVAAQDKEESRETKFLPRKYAEGAEMCNINIYGDEVALYWHTPTPRGIAIKSRKLNNVMKTLFDMAWELVGQKEAETKGWKKK